MKKERYTIYISHDVKCSKYYWNVKGKEDPSILCKSSRTFTSKFNCQKNAEFFLHALGIKGVKVKDWQPKNATK